MPRKRRETRSWLAHTGQRWKAWLGYALLAAWGGTFIALVLDANRGAAIDALRTLVGLGLGFVGFLWLALSIRCRVCGASVAWHWMRRSHWSTWVEALHTADSCPVCGDQGVPRGWEEGHRAGGRLPRPPC